MKVLNNTKEFYEAVEQAVTDSKSVKIPAVFHRRNHKPWLVTVRLDDIEAFSIALQKVLSQQKPAINLFEANVAELMKQML